MKRLLSLILGVLVLSSHAFATNDDWSLIQVAGEETYRSAVVGFPTARFTRAVWWSSS